MIMDNAENILDQKRRILIVDDDRSNIMVLNHILKPTYTTLAAISGAAAVAAAKTAVPDLVLLDIVMPDMSGFEVLTELKREDTLKNIPVIFITALDNAEDEEKGFALGAVDYIKKPFSAPIVIARVNTHLKMAEYIREIERFGVTDPLTGLPNRRAFDERMKSEWNRAVRASEPLSLLMIDADNFKSYNDTYGHMHGDILLKTIAGVFAGNVKRAGDFVARWGGEEFAALLPNSDAEMAGIIAERMRSDVEKIVIAHPSGHQTRITVSIGVRTATPSMTDSIEDFISAADSALYRAKKSGKNRVCAW